MIRKLLVVTAGLVLLMAAPAAAGGWAVSTLDQAPTSLVAGQDTQVGFMIRQHGKTPVNPDSGSIGIRLIEQGTGHVYEFPAAQTGPTGHFVATVRPPTAGAFTWEVLQGWFAPQDLGPIPVVGTVASPPAAPAAATPAASASSTEWWRIAGIAIAGGLGLVFVADLVLGRRSARRRDDLGAGRVPRVIARPVRLASTGLLAAGLALVAAAWPSRPPGSTAPGAGPASSAPSLATRGESVFHAKGCATCHDGPTSRAAVSVGPDLGEVGAVGATRVAGLDAEAYVRQSVRTPQAFVVPGYTEVLMPTLPVDDQELDALVRYLLG